ncbi:MAG: EamA family transporter [Rhodospirillales bacterium]|nr:EamA family transporter [Rhodospirillales bacterium]
MLMANLGLVMTLIFWGTMTPVVNELLKEWDPVTLVAARFLVTSAVFLVWLRLSEGGFLGRGMIPWRQVLVLGGILALFSVLITVAIRFSNPITIAVIGAAGPISASLIDRLLTGRNPPWAVLTAIPLVVVGGVIADIDLDALSAGEAAFHFQGGEIIMVGCVFLWPLYSALMQRWFDGMSQLRRTALSFISAMPMVLGVAAILLVLGWEDIPHEMPDARGWGLFLWTTLATSIIGTFLWNVSVGRLGVVIATMFLNLIPGVAILTAMMFGIEPRMEQLIGCGLVIVAVAQAQIRLFLFKKKKPA